MHALEKILARCSGRRKVEAGDVIVARVDWAGINDIYPQVMDSFRSMGGERVHDPERVMLFFDHYAPAPTIAAANIQKNFRDFAAEQGITHVFDVDAGVCHQVLVESGLLKPGQLVVITDSHTTTHGAVGAFGTGLGATDMAAVLLTGELWFRVPQVIKVVIEGELQPGVMAKDIILKLLGTIGTGGAVYQAIEYTGSVVEAMSLAERLVLCNMAVELGAKTTYIRPSAEVIEYLKSRGAGDITVEETDPDYQYAKTVTLDGSALAPQVAAPHSVDNVFNVTDVEPVKVNQVLIGACTGGRAEDFAVAARILAGKKVASGTRLILAPASKATLARAWKEGSLPALLAAGGTLASPGCGACIGIHQGILADDEVCVTTSSRNFPGRMGSDKAKVYLASPATAAACALTGRITDPRELL